MKTIARFFARFFKALYLFFDGFCKPAHPIPQTVPKKTDNRTRLRYLLSRSDLAADEQGELAKLVSGLEGDVIFLDPLVPAAKEEL